MVTKTRLTTQIHRKCKYIIIQQKPTYGSKASFPFLLNRMIMDCHESFSNMSEGERHSMLMRIYYLSQQIEPALVFSEIVSMNIHFKEKADQMIAHVIEFNNRNKSYLKKDFIPNVIIMDYMRSVELKGENFLNYYLVKHNHL